MKRNNIMITIRIVGFKKIIKISFSILFLISILSCNDASSQYDFVFEDMPEGVLLRHGDSPVYFYQAATKSIEGKYPRANYLHPLYGLQGEILTEDFPEDHLHHRGVFWTWHQFYVKNERVGDPWECRDITWEVESIQTEVFDDSAILNISLFWTGNLPGTSREGKENLMKEETRITTINIGENQREINFEIKLTALHEGTAIGGSDDHKGYGGFSIRTKLPDDLNFYSSGGKVKPMETAIDAGGWIDMRGTFDPDLRNQTYITILCDPADPDPFHGWILRDKGSMQNAAFPGAEPVKILPGETLDMKYKLFLHSPDIAKQKIDLLYKNFVE